VLIGTQPEAAAAGIRSLSRTVPAIEVCFRLLHFVFIEGTTMKCTCWRVIEIMGLTVGMLVTAMAARGQSPKEIDAAKLKEVLLGLDHEKKFEDFNKTVQGAQVHEGLFRMHQKDDKLYAEIKPEQLNRPLLCPIAIARGMAFSVQARRR
jgi:hypothetical protein